jgi:hypothetical protein
MVLFNFLFFLLLVYLKPNSRVLSLTIALYYLKIEVNATQVANHHILQLHSKVSVAQRIHLMQTMRITRDKMILLTSFSTGSIGQPSNIHSSHLFRLKLESAGIILVTNYILPKTVYSDVITVNQMQSLVTTLNHWQLLAMIDDHWQRKSCQCQQ